MTKIISLSAFLLAVALIVLGGCVPSEEDFIADHPGPGSNEGSLSNPIDLGTTPISRSSSVGAGGSSYYFANPTLGTATFTITGLTGDADLRVYFDSGFSSLLCSSTNSSTTTDSCSASCSFSLCNVWVKVTDFVFSDGGTSYTLSVTVF